MTEDEAKTKWCPFARTLGWNTDAPRQGDDLQFVYASENREVGPYDKGGEETFKIAGRHRCIGSACMAWRWDGWEYKNLPPVKGYCGLAGKP